MPHAATTPIFTAFKCMCMSHRTNGLVNRLPEKARFPVYDSVFVGNYPYREVTSPQPAQAPKTRFEGKTFYFVEGKT
jgi:hypothetical protein